MLWERNSFRWLPQICSWDLLVIFLKTTCTKKRQTFYQKLVNWTKTYKNCHQLHFSLRELSMANGCESQASFSRCVFVSHCCFQRWRQESYVLYVLLKKVYWVWIPLGTLQFIFYRYVFTKFLFQRKIAPISSPSRKTFNVSNNVNEFESCDALSLNLCFSYAYLHCSYVPHTFVIILIHT